MATAITPALSQKEQDIQMMLAADVHLGTKNCDFQTERYVFKRQNRRLICSFTWILKKPRNMKNKRLQEFLIMEPLLIIVVLNQANSMLLITWQCLRRELYLQLEFQLLGLSERLLQFPYQLMDGMWLQHHRRT